jgi:hypothetical protein
MVVPLLDNWVKATECQVVGDPGAETLVRENDPALSVGSSSVETLGAASASLARTVHVPARSCEV